VVGSRSCHEAGFHQVSFPREARPLSGVPGRRTTRRGTRAGERRPPHLVGVGAGVEGQPARALGASASARALCVRASCSSRPFCRAIRSFSTSLPGRRRRLQELRDDDLPEKSPFAERKATLIFAQRMSSTSRSEAASGRDISCGNARSWATSTGSFGRR